jgi:hypothetical protein
VITVPAGEPVHFVIDGTAPQNVTATLLDGPGGMQTLGSTTDVAYTVPQENGRYRVQVNVEYADVEGSPSYVSYVFGLDVGTGTAVAAAMTAEVETVTEVPEITPTIEPSATPTSEPSATPTKEPSPTLEPTATTGSKPTLPPLTVEVTLETEEAELMPAVTQEVETPLATAEIEATEAVIPVVTPTVFVPQPAVTNTSEPQAPTESFPTPLPTTVTETPNGTPTQALVIAPSEVPSMSLFFAGRTYEPIGYRFCQRSASGESLCLELPTENASARRISFQRGAATQLRIGGDRPTEVRIEYLSDEGQPTGQPEIKRGDNIILFSITAEPGTYILATRVVWADYESTYFFRISVVD